MNIQELRNKLEREKGRKSQIEQTLNSVQNILQNKTRSLHKHEKAREIIHIVGIKTQEQLQYHISDITTLALDAVFPDPYKLKVKFIQRRNKTECDLIFVRDDMEIDPMEESGLGAVDVAAFTLRIASWSMERPRTHNTIILDEPFKHLKGEVANKRVLDMINEISKRLGIQIIMISDERIPREDIITAADRAFEVSIKNRISQIKVL